MFVTCGSSLNGSCETGGQCGPGERGPGRPPLLVPDSASGSSHWGGSHIWGPPHASSRVPSNLQQVLAAHRNQQLV